MKRILQYFITALLYGLVAIPVQAQFGTDLGQAAVSTLAWQDIFTTQEETIGLTTDGRVYLWGDNSQNVINTNQNALNAPIYQTVPYYKPMPEVITKVRLMNTGTLQAVSYPGGIYTFFALGQSGKLYVWGVNTGLFGNAWPGASIPSLTDTTKVSRTPTPLAVPGESVIIDFEVRNGTLLLTGASGKAYVLGYYTKYLYTTTPKTLPNPTGVGSSFKYTKLWGTPYPDRQLYLKGNDGNIYVTSESARFIGVPSLFSVDATNGPDGIRGDPTTINPVLVPFPAGEDIVSMRLSYTKERVFAISASGKAFMTGYWRTGKKNANGFPTSAVFCPIKQATYTGSDIQSVVSYGDTTFYAIRFVEVAMPPGATGVLDITDMTTSIGSTMIVGNNHKVYWSGGESNNLGGYTIGNQLSSPWVTTNLDLYISRTICDDVSSPVTNTPYSWGLEAINYKGAARIIRDVTQVGGVQDYFFIISASGRGYFLGKRGAYSGIGKGAADYQQFPVPILNEQLLSCQTSAGTGGPLGDPVSTPAAGVIDCSKTKLYPAPVQGTPSELSLLVTINVTTIGDFSPITISGSGMSLVSGFDKVSATTTGVQTFHIPIKYDGSTLTNAFQFTIGQAGSCSADLTNKPSNEITKVWSLNNCTAITPGSLSK